MSIFGPYSFDKRVEVRGEVGTNGGNMGWVQGAEGVTIA